MTGMKNVFENEEQEKEERCRRNGESRSIPSQSSIATDRLYQDFDFVPSIITPSESENPFDDKQSEDQMLCFADSPAKYALSPLPEDNLIASTSARTGGFPSPGAISPFPSPPYPAILSFNDLKRLKSTKYIFVSPTFLDFEREDRDSYNLKNLLFKLTCLSLIGWIWLAVVLFFKATVGEVPAGLWVISTWLIYLRLSISSILYAMYYAEEWLIMWKMEWYYKRYGASVELSSCSLKIGDPKAVQLTKLSIFKC